jgi:ADP-ribosylglycohydrolase
MFGAVAGDVIGSAYEWNSVKKTDFELFTDKSRFTDDTVLTIATASALTSDLSYSEAYRHFAQQNRGAGYGGMFVRWVGEPNPTPYNSYGNGSAMRVSPVAWAFETIEQVLAEAKKSAEVTHSHPEGIKGAQATASAIFMARNGASKKEIKNYIVENFQYDLNRTIDEIRPNYRFDVTCQGSVPESIIAFLEGTSWEETIRLAVSLGGDSDTQACIAGSIAEAYYGAVPQPILDAVTPMLTNELREVAEKFKQVFMQNDSMSAGS